MNVTLCPADRLTDAQVEHWSQLQAANPNLRNPFFHPDYAREAAAVWGNVEVGIVEDGGEPVGYFPFQRTARNVGRPVGGLLCDCQGLIAAPGFTWDAAALVRGCRLSGWRFTQLIASQQPFRQYHWRTAEAHSLDLSGGFDAYCRQRREAGSVFIPKLQTKQRKAIREVGPLCVEAATEDPQVLDSLIEWKSEQYRRNSAVNYLTKPGTLDLIKRLLTRKNDEFRGMLSAMYLGDHLVAVSLGLRCRNVLHGWFISYNEEFAKYSPGSASLVEFARAAAEMGIERFDLGRGDELFKTSLRSFGTPVAEGAVGLGLLSSSLGRTWLHTKHWVESSRLRTPARSVVRKIRGLFLRTSN